METTADKSQSALHPGGLSRWDELRHLIPMDRRTWQRLGKSGRAPVPERMGKRLSLYRNSQILSWLADPANWSIDAQHAENRS
jgi:predicted DNA-binding transcriptional regulator AlpA